MPLYCEPAYTSILEQLITIAPKCEPQVEDSGGCKEALIPFYEIGRNLIWHLT